MMNCANNFFFIQQITWKLFQVQGAIIQIILTFFEYIECEVLQLYSFHSDLNLSTTQFSFALLIYISLLNLISSNW